MNIETKRILDLIKNNKYCINLEEYLSDRIKKGKLNYDNLKYLYDNLYKDRALHITKNIYQVAEFFINGYSKEEAEKIAKILPDANKYLNSNYDKKDKGYMYNKLFSDLEFAYNRYDTYVQRLKSKEDAFEKLKNEISITNTYQRKVEVKLYNQSFKNQEEVRKCCDKIITYINKIVKKLNQIEATDKQISNKEENKLLNKYESLKSTLDKCTNYAMLMECEEDEDKLVI